MLQIYHQMKFIDIYIVLSNYLTIIAISDFISSANALLTLNCLHLLVQDHGKKGNLNITVRARLKIILVSTPQPPQTPAFHSHLGPAHRLRPSPPSSIMHHSPPTDLTASRHTKRPRVPAMGSGPWGCLNHKLGQ